MIYLDNAAGTPAVRQAVEAALPFISEFCGNPSSVHSEGRRAALAIVEAREKCAAAIGALPEEIFFTSGGTESDNTALKFAATAGFKCGKRRIVTTEIEHAAVLKSCGFLKEMGFEIKLIGSDNKGYVSVEQAQELITPDTAVVSVMAANNEVGTVQPIEEIAEICHSRGVLFHTDAVQAMGNIPLDVNRICCDMMSVSAHKIGGIRGAGLLYCRKGLEVIPLLHGGGQENGVRSGTENTAAIAAMGAAMEYCSRNIPEKTRKISKLRDHLVELLLMIPGSRLNGGMERRLCGNVNVSFSGVEGEALVLGLDLRGVCASSGSACASGDVLPSHVLRAMRVPEEYLSGSLRLTLSENTTQEQIEEAAAAVKETVDMLRTLSG